MPLAVHVNGIESLAVAAPSDPLLHPFRLSALLERAVRTVLEERGVRTGEVSLTLLADSAIADLNSRFLRRTGSTDVIAFAMHGPGEPVLGDVYVGAQHAVRQAAELGVTVHEELVRVAIHGVLHVLGFDHDEGPEREHGEMWRLQEKYVEQVLRA